MGKGEIISETGAGKYQVKIIFHGRDRVNAQIEQYETAISELETEIAGLPEGIEKSIKQLQKTALEKSKAYLENKMPDDPTISSWCADLTEGLTGNVGTIEVPGERDGVNIQPGYDDNAPYSAERDGQLGPAISTSAYAAFFNRALLPGWQKWKPTYRYGTIIADSIDFDANICDVCLDPAYSSQQNLDVNQNQGFSECDGLVPDGFTDFCNDNPAHPTCTNTEEPGSYNLNDTDYQKIQEVQAAVNAEHGYQTDESGYGIGEHWAIMGPGDAGDCEDFVLTKMQELIDYGIPVKNLQIAAVATDYNVDHAVLIIQTANRGTLVLDNRYDGVKTINTVPYRFEFYQAAGQTWKSYTTQLTDVPIEYMSCNALAFADGDEVIVKFESQDWDNPKVIGFKENPSACTVDYLYAFGGDKFTVWGEVDGVFYPGAGYWWSVGRYEVASDSWAAAAIMPRTIDVGGNTYAMMIRAFIMAVSDESDKTWVTGGSIQTAAYDSGGTPRPEYVVDYNDRYDKSLIAWTERMALSGDPRSLGHGWLLSGKVHVVGGVEYYSNPDPNVPILYFDSYSAHHAYNDDADSWAAKTADGKHFGHAAFKIGSKGYIAGGGDGQLGEVEHDADYSNALSSCREYNPDSDVWAGKNNLPQKFYGCGGFHLSGVSKGYVVGGYGTGKKLEEFDSALNVWTSKTDCPFAMPGYCGQQTGAINQAFTSNTTDLYKWDPATDAWTAKASSYQYAPGGEGGRLTT